LEKFNIEISEYAHSEIDDAREFYNLQKDGLGDDFKYDVFLAITNIATFPNLYPNINTNVKRCLLHRFPYSIFYAIREQSVVILSVAHQHRKPRYF
jgi:plasmid stabilization system protein ParE